MSTFRYVASILATAFVALPVMCLSILWLGITNSALAGVYGIVWGVGTLLAGTVLWVRWELHR